MCQLKPSALNRPRDYIIPPLLLPSQTRIPSETAQGCLRGGRGGACPSESLQKKMHKDPAVIITQLIVPAYIHLSSHPVPLYPVPQPTGWSFRCLHSHDCAPRQPPWPGCGSVPVRVPSHQPSCQPSPAPPDRRLPLQHRHQLVTTHRGYSPAQPTPYGATAHQPSSAIHGQKGSGHP